MKNVLLIVAQNGFQTKEYGDAKQELEKAGCHVTTASMNSGEAISNVDEHITVDMAVPEVDIANFDAMYTIGGPGALRSLDNDAVRGLFAKFKNETSKPYGGICVSPRILAKAGVLRGIRATGWNADRKLGNILKDAGAIYEEKPVIEDGRVITADGPASAAEWGKAIAKNLTRV